MGRRRCWDVLFQFRGHVASRSMVKECREGKKGADASRAVDEKGFGCPLPEAPTQPGSAAHIHLT